MSLKNLSNIRTLVVKVGSSLVTAGGKGIDQAALDRWAAQIAELGKQGVQTVLVSTTGKPVHLLRHRGYLGSSSAHSHAELLPLFY